MGSISLPYLMAVSTVHNALGSIRNGTVGPNASYKANMASVSWRGSNTPPFSLILLNPKAAHMAFACATISVGFSALFCLAASQPVAVGSVLNANAPPAPSYL